VPDLLSLVERGLKAVRFGIFQANDNLAYLLEGLCCAPEESKDTCGSCGRPKDAAHRPDCRNPDAREFAFDQDHEPQQYAETPMGPLGITFHPDSAASPQVAVVAPSPKQGSDSPPRDSAIPPAPSGGTQLEVVVLTEEVNDALHLLIDAGITPKLYELLHHR
jgi:hypothetical protein